MRKHAVFWSGPHARNPHLSADARAIRLQNRHALACGPLQPEEKPHAHAWRFCSRTMQPQKAYVRITGMRTCGRSDAAARRCYHRGCEREMVRTVGFGDVAGAGGSCRYNAVASLGVRLRALGNLGTDL